MGRFMHFETLRIKRSGKEINIKGMEGLKPLPTMVQKQSKNFYQFSFLKHLNFKKFLQYKRIMYTVIPSGKVFFV